MVCFSLPSKRVTVTLLLLLISCCCYSHGRVTRDNKYSWNTGSWGLCWSEEGCGPGIEERTVWCADQLDRTVPEALCVKTTKPPVTRNCYTTCQGGTWQPGPWSDCKVEYNLHSSHGSDGTCMGAKYRNVSCLTQLTTELPPLPCTGPEPPKEAPCTAECPQDCQVGPWSEWTECVVCGKLQSRNRAVIVTPRNGGSQCPRLTEVRVCEENCEPPTTTPEPQEPWLEVGEWSDCNLLRRLGEQPHEDGQLYKTPTIQKQKLEKKQIRVDVSEVKQMMKNKKVAQEKEELEVEEEDIGEEEEERSGDGSNDEMRESGRQQEWKRKKKRSVNLELDEAKEDMTRLETASDQADFIVENITDDSIAQIGTQTRNLTCYVGLNEQTALGRCNSAIGSLPTMERPCVLPRDCHVTEWSPWQTVTPGCVAPNGQVVHEVRERRRSALLLQQGSGTPCPHLVERHTLPRPRLIPCDAKYEWMPTSWGPCVSTVGPHGLAPVTCGGGVQKRKVFCARAHDKVPVDDDLCSHTQPPPVYQRCEVGCERDCQMGPWSAWGTCTPTDCSFIPPPAAPGFRRRRREVLVSPSAGGRECGPMEEQSECHGAQCHQWVIGPWHHCILEDSTRHCGPGHAARNLSCLDAFGRPSPNEECIGELGDVSTVKDCNVACPFDCVLAPWSDWSPCSRPCSSEEQVGYTRRNTTIMAPPGIGGRPCPAPDELTEVSTCRLEPCGGAKWAPGPWSSCKPDGEAVCGPGSQTRSLRCVGANNENLPLKRCRGLQQPQQERPCDVECGASCSVSPWSEWTQCTTSRPCDHRGLVSSVQRRYREILVAPWGVGSPCPPLHEERTCAMAPKACPGTHWRPGPWGSCHLNQGDMCGVGIRVRKITCVDYLGNPLEPTLCLLENTVVPEGSEPCSVSCVNQCTTSQWSEWSPCPEQVPCSDAASIRRRWLIDGSQFDTACQNVTLEERSPCPCHSHYSSPASVWSECIVGGHTRQGRINFIFGSSSYSISPFEYHPGHAATSDYFESSGTGIVRSDGSYSIDGIFDSYSVSDNSNGGSKTLPPAAPNSENSNQLDTIAWSKEKEMEREIREELNNEINLIDFSFNDDEKSGDDVEEYSPDSSSTMQQKGVCGVGARYRAVSCVRSDDVIVHPRACGHGGLDWEPCMVECPVDCKVDQWGSWSTCNSSCGPGVQTRTRKVVSPPLWGGRACPETHQSRSCWGTCEGMWATAGWGDCVREDGSPLSECGEGIQTRTVRCERETADGLREAVPSSECHGQQVPPTTQPCRVECPGECVVSPWAKWSECTPGCAVHSTRSRSREVLRAPRLNAIRDSNASSLSSSSCPSLSQEEPCLAGVSCWWYTWQVGNWTSCVPLGQSSCGEGVMNRPVACVRSDGVNVDERLCGEDSKPTPRETWCYVDCPIDCEVTPWTDWDNTQCSCGDNPGNMTRTRFISVNPSDSGRACPTQLRQQRPCPALPCYTWERGPWSHCQLQGAKCGHGIVEREVACVGSGGERVDPSLCLALFHVGGHTWPFLAHALDLNTKDNCFVSCNGGCELTEWSSWSHCHRDCSSGHHGGVQTRSRGILSEGDTDHSCNQELMQTRPCLAGPCQTFSWQLRDGVPKCVRSDEVIVSDGCDEKLKPCYPGCTVPHSQCSELGWCTCRPGYRGLYSQSQRYTLQECVVDLNGHLNSSTYSLLPLAQRMIEAKFVPDRVNIWMFAMIAVGSAFIVFVAISMYLLCHGGRQDTSPHAISTRSYSSASPRQTHGQHHGRPTASTQQDAMDDPDPETKPLYTPPHPVIQQHTSPNLIQNNTSTSSSTCYNGSEPASAGLDT